MKPLIISLILVFRFYEIQEVCFVQIFQINMTLRIVPKVNYLFGFFLFNLALVRLFFDYIFLGIFFRHFIGGVGMLRRDALLTTADWGSFTEHKLFFFLMGSMTHSGRLFRICSVSFMKFFEVLPLFIIKWFLDLLNDLWKTDFGTSLFLEILDEAFIPT